MNVKSKNPNDNADLILFRTQCVPSMKSWEKKGKHLIYHVHACFEIGDEDCVGRYRNCPYSTCSCMDGKFSCSHDKALLIYISLAQISSSKNMLPQIRKYFEAKEDPRLSQGVPILSENYYINNLDTQKTRKNVSRMKMLNFHLQLLILLLILFLLR